MSRISILNASAEDFALEIVSSAPVNGSVGDNENGRLVKYGTHIYVWCNHQGIWAKFANASDFTSLETRLSQQEVANDTDVASLEAIDSSLEVRISEEEDAMLSAVSSINVVAAAEESSLEIRLSGEEVARAADVDAEEARAIAAEGSVDTKLAQAISDREAAVSSEIARAEAAEGSLETRLSNEEDAKDAADLSLTNRVSAEESAKLAEDGSIATAIASAATARGVADSSLETRLSSEEDRVDAILAASTADKDSFAEVVSFINAIDLAHDTQTSTEISTLAADIASMEASLEAVDTSLETRLSGEEVQRAADDASLETRISEEEDAMIADAASLTTRKSAEESTRLAADNSLGGRIGVEEVARAAGDASLELRLSNEEDAMAAGDLSLETLLSGDAADRALDDSSIETRLSEEESAMLSAVASEQAVRVAADSSLELLVSAEEVARAAADASLTTRVSDEENAMAAADSSLETRLSNEESSEVVDKGSLETRLSNEEDAMAAGDSSVETRFSNEISTEKSRIDAILDSADADKDTFVELVSFITAFDVDADDALASYQLVIDSRISAEESNMAAGDASLEAELSSKIVERQSAITSLETKHSGEISTLAASIDSVEVREENRHLRVDFGGSTPVTSFTVPGTSFPTGFKMDEHGMVQVFQDMGSSKFRHLVAPVEIDMTSGDVTVQLGSSAKSGFAVFYMFADDEGAVTEVQNAYQMQMSTSGYDGDSSYYLATSAANAVGTAFPYEIHVKDYANATSQTSYGYTQWYIDGPFQVGIDWGNEGESGAVLRWYTAQSTDGGTTWSASSYYDAEITIDQYGTYGSDYFQMPSYNSSYDYPVQTLTEGALYKTWVEGYDANGALVLQAGSSSSPYYFADRSSFTAYPGMASEYDPVTSVSTNYYWNSSNSYVATTAQHGDTVDVTIVNPSHSNYAPGGSFSNAILSMNANDAASTFYGWNQDLTDWAVTGTDASLVDLSYISGVQSTTTDTSYISINLANNTIPAAGTYTFTVEAQGEDTGGNLLSKAYFNVTMIIS